MCAPEVRTGTLAGRRGSHYDRNSARVSAFAWHGDASPEYHPVTDPLARGMSVAVLRTEP
jgi:hypothetical protein